MFRRRSSPRRHLSVFLPRLKRLSDCRGSANQAATSRRPRRVSTPLGSKASCPLSPPSRVVRAYRLAWKTTTQNHNLDPIPCSLLCMFMLVCAEQKKGKRKVASTQPRSRKTVLSSPLLFLLSSVPLCHLCSCGGSRLVSWPHSTTCLYSLSTTAAWLAAVLRLGSRRVLSVARWRSPPKLV